MKKKEPKIVKSIRLSDEMIKLVQKRSKQNGKPFSETIRRAILAQYVKPTRTKDK